MKPKHCARSFPVKCYFDGVPFTIAARLVFDEETKRVLAVRSLFVLNEDGSKVDRRVDVGYLDDQEYAKLKDQP